MSSEPPTLPRVIQFGVFELDLRSGDLRKAGTRLNLPDQPLQILTALLERPGELVTRDELRQRLWPGDTFVDFEHGLNAAVKRLRDTLGDSADTPRFVETVPKRGYRFIGPMRGGEPVSPKVSLQPPEGSADLEGAALDRQISSLHQRLLMSAGKDVTRLFYEARHLLEKNPHNPDVLILLDQVRSAMDVLHQAVVLEGDPSAFAASMGAAAAAAILNGSSSPDLVYAYARRAARAALDGHHWRE